MEAGCWTAKKAPVKKEVDDDVHRLPQKVQNLKKLQQGKWPRALKRKEAL